MGSATSDNLSESNLSVRAFHRVRELVKQRSGIDLGDGKRSLVHGRLIRRLRKLGMADFDAYVAMVEDPNHPEAEPFLNSLTTNVTEFFREPHHFSTLAQRVVPELRAQHSQDRRIRIWSAGCSSGEEPYTIAIVMSELLPRSEGWDLKILASDIDSDILARAAEGVYPIEKVQKIEKRRLQRFFQRGSGSHTGHVRASDELRSLISFRRLNLMEAWPMRGPFDVIFCRNVIIYFDPVTRSRLVGRYADLLGPGGRLFLGHSESLTGGNHGLTPYDKTVYQKVNRAEAGR
jgi:chemotaxis protein methyltransferase CheR